MTHHPRHVLETRVSGGAANWALSLGLVAFLLAVFAIERLMTTNVVEVDALYLLVALCAIAFLRILPGVLVAGVAAALPVMSAALGETTYATAAIHDVTLILMCALTLAISAARTARIQADTTKMLTGRKVEAVRLLSHELRTPLTAVMGYAGLLEEMPEMAEHRTAIRSILQGADRLNRIVDSVLDVEPWWVDPSGLEQPSDPAVAGAETSSRFAKWIAGLPASWTMIVAGFWLVAIAVADVALNDDLMLPSLLVLVPLLASLRGSVKAVAVMAMLSTLVCGILGLPDSRFLSGPHVVAMVAVFAVGAMSIAVAYLRRYLEIARRHAEVLATYDGLTGLLTRNAILDRARAVFAMRHDVRPPLAVAMVDVDHFKSVNDRGGHQLGDRVLAEVGRRLKHSVRDSDLVGRIGGDEFLVVFLGDDDVRASTRRIAAGVSGTPIVSEATALYVTVSIGWAGVEPGIRLEEAMRQADIALFQAKERGRNQAVEFPVRS